MMPKLPQNDGTQTFYTAFAMSTLTVLFGFTKFAMPHIMRWIEIALT